MNHSELYHKTLLASRHALLEASQETQDAIVEAYGQVIRGLVARVSQGNLTADRAQKLAASIEEELKKYGQTVTDAINKGALNGAQLGAMGHKYALAKLFSNAGVAVELGHTFDEVPALALESLATRRGYIGGYAKMLATIQKRGLQKTAGAIDNYLLNIVGQGIPANEATKGLAHLMVDSVPLASKGLVGKYLGPKGGFKKGLSPAMKKYFATPDGKKAAAGARALLRDARRIAVHEINSAHHEADSIAVSRSPVVDNVRWQLSGRHANLPSSPDRCDILASEDHYGHGAGVFPSTAIPPLPHPYCLCKTAPIIKPVEEWGTQAAPAKAPVQPLASDLQPKFKGKLTQWSLPSNAHAKRVIRERKATAQIVKQSYDEKLPEAEPIKLEGIDFSQLVNDLEDAAKTAPVKFDIEAEYDADVAKSAKILEEHDIELELKPDDWATASVVEAHGKAIEEIKGLETSMSQALSDAIDFFNKEHYISSDFQEVAGFAYELSQLAGFDSANPAEVMQSALNYMAFNGLPYVKGKKLFPKFTKAKKVVAPGRTFSMKAGESVLDPGKQAATPGAWDQLKKSVVSINPEAEKWSNKDVLEFMFGKDIPEQWEKYAFPAASKKIDPKLDVQPAPSVAKKAAKEVKAYPNEPEAPKATATVSAPAEKITEKVISTEPPKGIPHPDDLEYVKELGGSTGAKLYRDPKTGKEYVVKRGASADHLREESLSDTLYELAGARVPAHRLYETQNGPVKVAEFVRGESLKQWQAKATARQMDALRKDARRHFAYDVLFGNWDVAGLDLDNILVSIPDGLKSPKVFRIDNGGSLRFRAMGTRKSAAEWSGVVSEIDSLRGLHPTIKPNRGAAWLYSGMTDKQVAQSVNTLLKKRDKILKASPPELREVLSGRMDTLARWLDEFNDDTPSILETKLDDVIEEIVEGDVFTDDFAEAVHSRKALGQSTLTDEGDIEDNQILSWWRYGEDGDAETLVSFKLRRETAVALERDLRQKATRVGGRATTTRAVDPVVQTSDNAWNGFLKAVKTVNHHVDKGDFAYNEDTMNALSGLLDEIKALHAKGQIEHPREWIDLHDLIVSKAVEKKKIPMVSQPPIRKVEAPKKKKAAPKTKTQVTVKSGWDNVETRTSEGVDRVTGKLPNVATDYVEEYTIKTDDYTIRFAGTESGVIRSYHGYVEIRVPGRPTKAAMAKIRSAFEEIGQVTSAAPLQYREALYVFRMMNFRRDVFPDSARLEAAKILGDKSTGYGIRLEKIKDIWRKHSDAAGDPALRLPGNKELRRLAVGEVTGKDGGGLRAWKRFDLSDSEVNKLEDLEISHASSMRLIDLVKALASRGGHVTPTFDRVRLGIPIRNGASPTTDLRNGPGTHFYAQLRSKGQKKNRYGDIKLIFGNKELRRLDSVHSAGDFLNHERQFKEVVFETMAKKADKYLEYSNEYDNEVLFKGGFSLYDVEKFIASSLTEKKGVAKFLKEWHGSDTWPDGRLIDDIIEVR